MHENVFKLEGGQARPLAPLLPAARPALERGQLHEIHACGDDGAAALAFALGGTTSSLATPGKATGVVLLVRMERLARSRTLVNGDGLARLGFDPARLVIVEAGNELDLLRAGLEGARCPGIELVLIETKGRFARYDLTASRRLALAAERSRACVIVLRHDAAPCPSAAHTRWSVASAPSVPLEANAPGRPAIEVELLRWRGGPADRCWRLQWDKDHGTFRDAGTDAPMPGALVPLSFVRNGEDDASSGAGVGIGHSRVA